MEPLRTGLYRFPWSQADNPGAWIEVTDRCNLVCRGCYRHKLAGDRPFEEITRAIDDSRAMTNCDSIMIAGGEPLLYPRITDVVRYIRDRGIKPALLTSGEGLSWELACELKNAGLAKIHFHVDSGQMRRGWIGKSELELNEIRQHFADLCWRLKGVQCGFNTTVYRSTLEQIPFIVKWAQANINKVQHYSLIAYRAIPLSDEYVYSVNGAVLDPARIPNSTSVSEEISITTEEMLRVLTPQFPGLHPGAYVNGSSAPHTHKYLVMVLAGSRREVYGCLGPKSLELVQSVYHLFKGRYCAFLHSQKTGRKVFALSLFDPVLRKALRKFLGSVGRNPIRFFESIYVQTLHLQQPYEILDGAVNLCEDCANKMVYEGRLISSCRLDEYRLLGGLLTPVHQDLRHRESLMSS